MFNLKNLLTIFRRELKAYFDSAIAYIYIIVFVLFFGALFMPQFFLIGQAKMRYFFDLFPLILCVFIPAVTMRLWAEDRRGNTFELLLTFPMESRDLVLGKFLASFVFYLCALIATIPVPIMVMVLGSPDLGPIIGGYIGAVLLGALFISVGIFISGMCKDQIVAFILAMIGCFGLFLIGLEFIAAFIDGWIPGLGSLFSKLFGVLRHYNGFVRGIIDFRSLLYFLSGTAVFLILNIFYIDGRLRPRYRATFSIAVTLCVLIIALFNWVFSDLPIGRFDLTSAKIYTTSEVTKDILRGLKAPVTVKYYVTSSAKMPTALKTLEQDVNDKLSELREVSGGRLKYKMFHMEAESVAAGEEESMEQQLKRKGIQPFQVKVVEADELQVKQVYSAIAISYKEKAEEIIHQVIPDNFNQLEYLIISKIFRLTMDKRPKVALMAPYIEQKIDPSALNALRQMGLQVPEVQKQDKYKLLQMILEYEGYEVSRINLTEFDSLPEDSDTLVVVQPEELNDRQRFEINKFLVEGGSVFLITQNYRFEYLQGPSGITVRPKKLNHGLNSLIENWGVTISEDVLLDAKNRVLNVSAGGMGPFAMNMPVKIPLHIDVDYTGVNKDISITSGISSLFYVWGSAVKVDDDKLKDMELTKLVLFESSPDSWEVTPVSRNLRPEDVVPPAIKDRNRKSLSVLLRGQFADAFESQTVPSWPKVDDEDESVEAAVEERIEFEPEPGQLLVVGGSFMFEEELFNVGGHSTFFLNAVDAITLGEELIKVRSKVPVERAIKRVSGGQKIMWRFFTIFFFPIIVAIGGSLHLILRKRLKTIVT
jgi:ABC-type uncharacterized transport system involved in gliding motility auxiliary subunit